VEGMYHQELNVYLYLEVGIYRMKLPLLKKRLDCGMRYRPVMQLRENI
jgi:hypothetical protein